MVVRIVFRRHAHRSLELGSASLHTLLNEEGKKASHELGKSLFKQGAKPRIFHSPIERAKETAKRIHQTCESSHPLQVMDSIGLFRRHGVDQSIINDMFQKRNEHEIIQEWLDGNHSRLFLSPDEITKDILCELRLIIQADEKIAGVPLHLELIGHDTTLLSLYQALTGLKAKPLHGEKATRSTDLVDFLEPLEILLDEKKATLLFRNKEYDISGKYHQLLE